MPETDTWDMADDILFLSEITKAHDVEVEPDWRSSVQLGLSRYPGGVLLLNMMGMLPSRLVLMIHEKVSGGVMV